MIRLGAWMWGGLAAAAAIGLFQIKYEVQALEDRLRGLNRQILQDQEAIHVLKAEWSYLNEPGRLAELARRHLDLAPVAPEQFARLEDLPFPLPVPPSGDEGQHAPGLADHGGDQGEQAGRTTAAHLEAQPVMEALRAAATGADRGSVDALLAALRASLGGQR